MRALPLNTTPLGEIKRGHVQLLLMEPTWVTVWGFPELHESRPAERYLMFLLAVFDSRMITAGHGKKKDVPMSNLYLGLLQLFGAERDRFD